MKKILSSIAIIATLFLASCAAEPAFARPNFEQVQTGVVEIFSSLGNNRGKVGSGFFVDENFIITNAHVVSGNKALGIFTYGNPKAYIAQVIAEDDVADIALLELKDWDQFKKDNSYYVFQLSKNVVLGEQVYSIGAPQQLNWSISQGIISNTHRYLIDRPFVYLQSDVAITHGNSGGPLLNDDGQIVGITSAIITFIQENNDKQKTKDIIGSTGLIIPSSIVIKVSLDLLQYQQVRWPVIGLEIKPDNNDLYPVINKVTPSGSADKAGLKIGDIIRGISSDGKTIVDVKNFNRFKEEIYNKRVNDLVFVLIERDGKLLTLPVKLDQWISSKKFEDSMNAQTKKTN